MVKGITQGTRFQPTADAGIRAGNLPTQVSKKGPVGSKNLGDALAQGAARFAQIEARRIKTLKRNTRDSGKLALTTFADKLMIQVQQELPGESYKWSDRATQLWDQSSPNAITGKASEILQGDKEWDLTRKIVKADIDSRIRKFTFAAEKQEGIDQFSEFTTQTEAAINESLNQAPNGSYASAEQLIKSFDEHANNLLEDGVITPSIIESKRSSLLRKADGAVSMNVYNQQNVADFEAARAKMNPYSDELGVSEGINAKLNSRLETLKSREAASVSTDTTALTDQANTISIVLANGGNVTDQQYDKAYADAKSLYDNSKVKNKSQVMKVMARIRTLEKFGTQIGNIAKILENPGNIDANSVTLANDLVMEITENIKVGGGAVGEAVALKEVKTMAFSMRSRIKSVADELVTASQKNFNKNFSVKYEGLGDLTKSVMELVKTPGSTIRDNKDIQAKIQESLQAYNDLGAVSPDQVNRGTAMSVAQMEKGEASLRNLKAVETVLEVASRIDRREDPKQWQEAIDEGKEAARKGGYGNEFNQAIPSLNKRAADRAALQAKQEIASSLITAKPVSDTITSEAKTQAIDELLDSTENKHGNPYESKVDGTVITYFQYLLENSGNTVPGSDGKTGAGTLQRMAAVTGFKSKKLIDSVSNLIRLNVDQEVDPEVFKSNFGVVSEITDHTGAPYDNMPQNLHLARLFHERYKTIPADEFAAQWRLFNSSSAEGRTLPTIEDINTRLNGLASQAVSGVASAMGMRDEDVLNQPQLMNIILGHSQSFKANIDTWWFAGGQDTDTILIDRIIDASSKHVGVDPMSRDGSLRAAQRFQDKVSASGSLSPELPSLPQVLETLDPFGGRVVQWTNEAFGVGDKKFKAGSPSGYWYKDRSVYTESKARDMFASDLMGYAKKNMAEIVDERFPEAKDDRKASITQQYMDEFEALVMDTEQAPNLYGALKGRDSAGFPRYRITAQIGGEVVYFQNTMQFGEAGKAADKVKFKKLDKQDKEDLAQGATKTKVAEQIFGPTGISYTRPATTTGDLQEQGAPYSLTGGDE